MEHLFTRKIYQQMLLWKEENNGKSALLVEGARRIGKSTIVEQFARSLSPAKKTGLRCSRWIMRSSYGH